MTLYVIENDNGEVLDSTYYEFTNDVDRTMVFDEPIAPAEYAKEYGSHVVELVKKPNPVEVTKEEAKIIKIAKYGDFNHLLYDDAEDYIGSSISDSRRVYDILRAYYTDSYHIKNEQLYSVPIPHLTGLYYLRKSDGTWGLANMCELDDDDVYQTRFTMAELKQYGLDDLPREEVPSDDDNDQ